MNEWLPETTPHASSDAEIHLARRLGPVIRFAANEPFLPSHVGVTVLTTAGLSPSAPLMITFEPGVARVIEYAIWWDFDIEHLYELEHVWLKLDAADRIVSVEASGHGRLKAMQRNDGSRPIEDGRVTLYSEPGKHAFHARPDTIVALSAPLIEACAVRSGRVLINAMFRDAFRAITSEDHRAVTRHLQQRAFLPSFRFTQSFDLSATSFLTWPALHSYIAARVPAVLAEIRAEQPLIKAVLLDSGDTLVDEGTERRDVEGFVVEADLIPGVPEMMAALVAAGYRLALVADGYRMSFETVLGGHGLLSLFQAEIISEDLDSQKPDPRMFRTALDRLGLMPEDAGVVVMVGNNLERDIKGANRAGMISVWLDWAPRRAKQTTDAEELPDYRIGTPGELPGLLEHIERRLGHAALAAKARAAAPDGEPTAQ